MTNGRHSIDSRKSQTCALPLRLAICYNPPIFAIEYIVDIESDKNDVKQKQKQIKHRKIYLQNKFPIEAECLVSCLFRFHGDILKNVDKEQVRRLSNQLIHNSTNMKCQMDFGISQQGQPTVVDQSNDLLCNSTPNYDSNSTLVSRK